MVSNTLIIQIFFSLLQFTVVIVLLSILRARMVNTYHRIFKEADVQWKFFRYAICPTITVKFNIPSVRFLHAQLIFVDVVLPTNHNNEWVYFLLIHKQGLYLVEILRCGQHAASALHHFLFHDHWHQIFYTISDSQDFLFHSNLLVYICIS